MSEKQPFEKTLSDLQAIIEELESENLSLDKMVHLFEDGMKLMKICRTQLDEVENRITTLVKENDEFSENNHDYRMYRKLSEGGILSYSPKGAYHFG